METETTDRVEEAGCGCTSVCSLPEDELRERIGMIRRDIAPHVVRSERLPTGRAWEFEAARGMGGKLANLIELERQCCEGLDFQLREAGAGKLRLTVLGVDPSWDVFRRLEAPQEPMGSARYAERSSLSRRIARIAGAAGIGVTVSFLVCCVLPIGLAGVAGGAIAASMASLDNPLTIGAASLAFGSAAWWLLERRGAAARRG